VDFRDHYSGGNATRSGIMSLFYGIPAVHNFWMNLLLEQKGPVLVHQMLEQGYEVEVCASASLVSPEFNRTVFSEVKDLRLKLQAGPQAKGPVYYREFMDFLSARGTEMRRFSHFYSMILPTRMTSLLIIRRFYALSGQISRSNLTNDTDPAPYFNRYKNSVHFVDQEIGKVLKALEEGGLAEDSIIIITSDHGRNSMTTKRTSGGMGAILPPHKFMSRW